MISAIIIGTISQESFRYLLIMGYNITAGYIDVSSEETMSIIPLNNISSALGLKIISFPFISFKQSPFYKDNRFSIL